MEYKRNQAETERSCCPREGRRWRDKAVPKSAAGYTWQLKIIGCFVQNNRPLCNTVDCLHSVSLPERPRHPAESYSALTLTGRRPRKSESRQSRLSNHFDGAQWRESPLLKRGVAFFSGQSHHRKTRFTWQSSVVAPFWNGQHKNTQPNKTEKLRAPYVEVHIGVF